MVLVVVIVGGLGSFELCKLLISNIVDFEKKGVNYFVKDLEMYCDKCVVIVGGGDLVFDWIIFFVEVVSEVILVYCCNSFRGVIDSVEKV